MLISLQFVGRNTHVGCLFWVTYPIFSRNPLLEQKVCVRSRDILWLYDAFPDGVFNQFGTVA